MIAASGLLCEGDLQRNLGCDPETLQTVFRNTGLLQTLPMMDSWKLAEHCAQLSSDKPQASAPEKTQT